MIYRILLAGIGISLFIVAIVMAHSNFTGYSGAPGSYGSCASSCHGSQGGTIEVTGFPTVYAPGNTYTLSISHNGGAPISGFNGSCRIGTGSENAGLISAGSNTVVYNESGETNGIGMSSVDLDNGTFDWTAPDVGTGDVTLYIAGAQGGYFGQNSEITLVHLINYKYKDGAAPNCPDCAK